MPASTFHSWLFSQDASCTNSEGVRFGYERQSEVRQRDGWRAVWMDRLRLFVEKMINFTFLCFGACVGQNYDIYWWRVFMSRKALLHLSVMRTENRALPPLGASLDGVCQNGNKVLFSYSPGPVSVRPSVHPPVRGLPEPKHALGQGKCFGGEG